MTFNHGNMSGQDRLASEGLRTLWMEGAFHNVVRTEQDVEPIFRIVCQIDATC